MLRKALGIAFVATAAMGAAPAMALTSYAGSDYSQDFNSVHQVRACDMESDSHGVHADFTVAGSGTIQQVRDGDGANNGCAATGAYTNKIYQHRAVEEINAAPDEFGPWKYPA
jgi:hypothetical protein